MEEVIKHRAITTNSTGSVYTYTIGVFGPNCAKINRLQRSTPMTAQPADSALLANSTKGLVELHHTVIRNLGNSKEITQHHIQMSVTAAIRFCIKYHLDRDLQRYEKVHGTKLDRLTLDTLLEAYEQQERTEFDQLALNPDYHDSLMPELLYILEGTLRLEHAPIKLDNGHTYNNSPGALQVMMENDVQRMSVSQRLMVTCVFVTDGCELLRRVDLNLLLFRQCYRPKALCFYNRLCEQDVKQCKERHAEFERRLRDIYQDANRVPQLGTMITQILQRKLT